MSEPRVAIPPLRHKAFAAGVCGIAMTIMLAAFLVWPTAKNHAPDPIVTADLKRARTLGKTGDWARSAQLIEPYVAGENPQAKLEYALLLNRGWGVTRDRERARQLLLQAVTFEFDNRGRAAFELGRLYKTSTGDNCMRIALEWFGKAAQWSYTKAHLELGTAYKRGLGTEPDVDEALRHFQIAATNGSAAAIWSMIEIVEKGTTDSEPNLQKARMLAAEYLPRLMVQAQGGNAYAARTLARLYLEGTVVAHNRSKAGRWFTEAARLGDPAAMHDLARLLMQANNGPDDVDAILDLLRESASRGYGGAMTAMGRLHLKEKYRLQRSEAVGWFTRGVAAGHGGAMEALARLYLLGDLVEANREEARRLITMGAKLRHEGSLRLLDEINSDRNEPAKSADAAQSPNRG